MPASRSRTKGRKAEDESHVRTYCPLGCGVSTKRKHDMARHLETHDSKTQFNYACPAACGQTSRQRSNIRVHFEMCTVANKLLFSGHKFSPEELAVLQSAPRKIPRKSGKEIGRKADRDAGSVPVSPSTSSQSGGLSAIPSPASLASGYTSSQGYQSATRHSGNPYPNVHPSAMTSTSMERNDIPLRDSSPSQMIPGCGLAGSLSHDASQPQQGMHLRYSFTETSANYAPETHHYDNIYPPIPQTMPQVRMPLFEDPIPEGLFGLFNFPEFDSNTDYSGMDFSFLDTMNNF